MATVAKGETIPELLSPLYVVQGLPYHYFGVFACRMVLGPTESLPKAREPGPAK